MQRLELCDDRAHENAPAHQAAVAVVKGVESRPAAGAAAEASTFEMSLRSLERAAVIGLQRQEIIGALGPDPRGDVLLAPHRVERHDGPSRCRVSSSSGMAVISFDLPSTSR